MKAFYLIIAPLLLSGCSNTPSTSDVERVLESAVSSCQNVEVAKIRKTNGYEKDGYYRVEYEYVLQLKNSEGFAKLRQAWLEEKDREAEFIPARAEYERQVREVKDEITRIESTFEDKRPDQKQFSATGMSLGSLQGNERVAYDAVYGQWLSDRHAATEDNRKKINELERSWKEERAKVPRPVVSNNVDNTLHAFFSQGCSQAGWKYASGLINAHVAAVNQANVNVQGTTSRDMSPAFEEQTARMTGVMAMHKTEKGWQPVSEAM